MGRIVIVRRSRTRKISKNSEKIGDTIPGTGKKSSEAVVCAGNSELESFREEIELKIRRRKREREASRVALDRLERSVDFDDSLEAEKEIRFMCRSSPNYYDLNRLGLFLKRDYNSDMDEDEEAILSGDHYTITNKPFKFHINGQIMNGGDDQTLLMSPTQAARVSMLKTRFMDVISKSQQQLGLLDRGVQDFNIKKQKLMINNDASFKRSTRQYFKTKATINAPNPTPLQVLHSHRPYNCTSFK